MTPESSSGSRCTRWEAVLRHGSPGGKWGEGSLAAPSPRGLRTLGPGIESAPGQWLAAASPRAPGLETGAVTRCRTQLRAAPSVAPLQLGHPSVSSYPSCRGRWGKTPPPPTPAPCHSGGCHPPRALGTFFRGGGRSSACPALRNLQLGWDSYPHPRGPRRPGQGGQPPTVCGPSRPPAAPAQIPHPSRPWALLP